MIHEIEISNTLLILSLVTVEELNDDSEPFRSLYNHLKAWNQTSQIKEINFTQDEGNPLLYTWKAERTNARILNSTFTFDSDTDLDPDLTIDLDPSWPLSVMIRGGPTRQQLIGIRAKFGLISFTVEFI